MPYALTWLPAVLENAGLKVATVPGWESRGRREIGEIAGIICHHTACALAGNMPSLSTLIDGRSDLPGPLSQLGLGRDGTFYVIAAGRCNHAGAGMWHGQTDGNGHYIGIEAENAGTPDVPWPEVQLAAYRHGVAAILSHLNLGADCCIGHKEFAPGRKTDPSFDMGGFRLQVAAILGKTVPPLVLIPAVEAAPPEGSAPRPTLRRGASGELVKVVQAKCHATADGLFGADTEAAVRALQRSQNMVPDGIVGPKTWAALDALP